jgi:hypothetical protein
MSGYNFSTSAMDDSIRENGGARYEATISASPDCIVYIPMVLGQNLIELESGQEFPPVEFSGEVFSLSSPIVPEACITR